MNPFRKRQEVLFIAVTHELSTETANLLRDVFGPIRADLTIANAKLDNLYKAINSLDRKVNEHMATQEQRLQAISNKIDEVLLDLKNLRENNPQIEDEISAIENKLSITQPSTGVITGDEAGG